MSNQIYTYSLIKAFYDSGKDYIDSFWPIALRVIPQDNSVDIDFIKHELKEKYGLMVPSLILETILQRAVKRGAVTRNNRAFLLTDRGLEMARHIDTEKDVNRRINSLIEHIINWFKEKAIRRSQNEIQNLLFAFVQINLEPLILFINPNITHTPLFSNKEDEMLLIEYIEFIGKSQPEMYNIFKEIIQGSIISATINARDKVEFNELIFSKLRSCKIFLDTNYLISVLDIHAPEISKPAQELFDLLKSYHFDIYVFDFTIDELCSLIKMFPSSSSIYPVDIKIDSIFWYLKRIGWKKTDAFDFINDADDIIRKKGIKIYPTEINYHSYKPKNPQLIAKLTTYKPEQKISAQNHDFAAIEEVIKIRRSGQIRRIEDSKSLFLTSDGGLFKFNSIEYGHEQRGTISEVILDRLLMYILWLKNPKLDLSINTLIACHARELFVDKNVWERFFNLLQKLKAEKKIDENGVFHLFYHNYIEDKLVDIDRSKLDVIDEQYILTLAEEAQTFVKKVLSDELELKDKEFKESLETFTKERKKMEEEKEKKWYSQLTAIKNKVRRWAGVTANILAIVICIILVVIIFYAGYVIYNYMSYHQVYEYYKILITSSFDLALIISIVWKLYENIKSKLADRLNAIFARQLKLENPF